MSDINTLEFLYFHCRFANHLLAQEFSSIICYGGRCNQEYKIFSLFPTIKQRDREVYSINSQRLNPKLIKANERETEERLGKWLSRSLYS